MIHYLVLTISTLIILYLAVLIWRKTRSIGFMLGIAILYYWSLLGPWFIVFDELTGQKGQYFGLAYYDYLTKLFPVHADTIYLKVIGFYALFIIIIELTILVFAKDKKVMPDRKESIIKINHFWLIAICIGATIVSLFIVWTQILIAAKFNQSVYYITRNYHDNYYTIHQLLNQAAVVSLYIGFIAFICGEKSQLISGSQKRIYIVLYAIAIFIIEGYLLFLGNKREMFFGGILGVLFYFTNVNNKINYRKLFLFIAIIMLPLFFNDGLRSYSPTFLTNYFDVSGLEFHPKEIVQYTQFSVANTIFRFLFSNEMFVPHFSMYGILSHHIPLTYGTSFVSLGASVVPHFMWPDRPEGVYEYYVSQVNAMEGTGYTIHHASAWYLNFGIPGIIMGAFVLGWLWTFFYNKFLSIDAVKNNFLKIIYVIGFSAFTAQLASLIRGGPEGYKALFFEALILPTLIIFLASLFQFYVNKRK